MPFLRKYNTLTVTGTTAIRIPIIKRAVVDFAVGADWTPAAGDVKIAVDGAAAANVTNLPTAVAMGNGAYWEFILTAAELTCKSAVITVADSATKAVEDQSFIVETFGHASAMYQADLSAANLPANVTQINADATAAANLRRSTKAMFTGTTDTGCTTTSLVTSALTPAVSAVTPNQIVGRTVIFDEDTTTVALRNQATNVTASSSSVPTTLTVAALTVVPGATDTFIIV